MRTAKTNRLGTSMRADIKFQFKHGFYYVYLVLALLYVALCYLLPTKVLAILLPILLYQDPSTLGLFFIGGMVMLEKEQGILSLLYVTPLRVHEYLLSKVLTLALLSVASAVFVAAFAPVSVHFGWLVLGIMLASPFYTLLGFVFIPKAKTVNGYLVRLIPLFTLMFLPCLSLVKNVFIPAWLNHALLLVPSVGGLKLVLAAFTHITTLEALLSAGGLMIGIGFALKAALKALNTKIITQSGV